MTDIKLLIRRALETYQSAVLAKDADAMMRLYDAEVRIFDTWGVWSCEGAGAWRISIEGWFSGLGTDTCRVLFEDVKIDGGPEFASMSAITTYTGVTVQGEAVRSMQNRITWVLKVSSDSVRIIHEHTSVPVGFDDAKGILKRVKTG